MPLALFDLDNTLLTGDSDYLWGQYLVDNKIVAPSEYEEKNRQFFEDYEKGTLDIDSYLKFSLTHLSLYPLEQLFKWREEFLSQIITPIIAPQSAGIIEQHRSKGDTLMIISATNLFITKPIADLLNIPHIIATEPELLDGAYTGNYIGEPTFKEGKVTALNLWLSDNNLNLEGSTFYSDSHNDLPLLRLVDNPIAVNPDTALEQVATENNWPILDFKNANS